MKRALNQKSTSPSVDLRALAEYVEQFSTKTIVLLGDFVADVFEFGDISRVSREAPVLILRHRETQLLPGGGANAANNFADLGAKILPVTAVGDDANGNALIQYFRAKNVDVSRIIRVKDWCTPAKTRFLAGWAHTVGQQVLRVDREPQTPLPDAVRKKITPVFIGRRKTRRRAGGLRLRLRRCHASYGFRSLFHAEKIRAHNARRASSTSFLHPLAHHHRHSQ